MAQLGFLPLSQDIESATVLRKLSHARGALGELKGVIGSIPNAHILINTLALQEAKDSSAIENIITTHDELFKTSIHTTPFTTVAAKEVHSYTQALMYGFEQVQSYGLLTSNHILSIQSIIQSNNAGYRKLPGTVLKNENSGEVVYTPPQHPDEILRYMDNLERFINDDTVAVWDDLTKMAVIHYQFESIHPFYDGKGRTGRIINILYLVKQGLLPLPVLYLSRYINQNKAEYYHLLRHTRDSGEWEQWLMFMLSGVEEISQQTVTLIKEISELMQNTKMKLRNQLPKIYSHDLLNNIFKHPYTKIEFIMEDLAVSRSTATRYLDEMSRIAVLDKQKMGRDNYYINTALFQLLQNVHQK